MSNYKGLLSERLLLRIVKAVTEGSYPIQAVVANGVARNTFYEWIQRARRDEAAGIEPGFEEGQSRYLALALALDEAEAVAEQKGLEALKATYLDDPKAVQFFMERRFPERWRKRESTEVIKRTETSLTVEVLTTQEQERERLTEVAKLLLGMGDKKLTEIIDAEAIEVAPTVGAEGTA
jgi:transposase-like protein